MDANAESEHIIAVAERLREKVKRMEELAQELSHLVDMTENLARRAELASRPSAPHEARE